MRKRNAIVWMVCAAVVCGILAFSVIAGSRLGKRISAIQPAGTRIRETICAYVLDNRDRIIEEFEMMRPWGEEYAAIYETEGKIYGVRREGNFARALVDDRAVTAFVNGENATDLAYPWDSVTGMEIAFEKDGIISVKVCGMGNVTYAHSHGYYYSPEDVPLWVCAEISEDYADRTGKYLYYPLDKSGEVWTADIAAIEEAAEKSFIDDYCTLHICENLYYFCYGW
ncbi:MAG: hypothetical protein E7337_09330 [Clostridiales bacterium]|nr:hypothetical protein [Clostridiales bacterium]